MTDTANAPERIFVWPHGETTWADIVSAFFKRPTWLSKKREVAEYVLATHCDELVAAAYLDARDSINEYPRVAPEADEANAYDEQIEHCQGIIDARIPANAIAALTARDERMKAEGAREAQAKIEKLEALADALRQVSSFNGYTNDGRVSITTVPETKTVHFTAADMAEAQAKIARLTMIANELSWSKKTRDISNRLFAALQENANG